MTKETLDAIELEEQKKLATTDTTKLCNYCQRSAEQLRPIRPIQTDKDVVLYQCRYCRIRNEIRNSERGICNDY